MTAALVTTKFGQLQGVQEGRVFAWRGVPYAKPPLGNLRFRPPQAPEPWEGIKEAQQFAPRAMQPLLWSQEAAPEGYSEDCLYLNIWSPAADHKKRPVMVWIHGGFFTVGSGSDPRFNGTAMAELNDVVLVTMNYRLGPFGFLQLRQIGGEDYAASGNCGMLDQVAALTWVKENIAAFGGDPDNVTIFGQSAGGRSVGLLLSMPSAKGLFQKAIIHSGGIQTIGTADNAAKLAEVMLHKLNISKDNLSELHEITAEAILEAAPMPHAGNGMEPNIDGEFLPNMPLEAVAAGDAIHIPIMAGYTLNDFTRTFDPSWERMSEDEILQYFQKKIGSVWDDVSPLYLEQKGDDVLEKLIQLLIRNEFAMPATRLVELQAGHGTAAWLFRYDYPDPKSGLATHGSELPYIFNTAEDSDGHVMAVQMYTTWAAFARNGNPNNKEIPDWPAYDLKRRPTMLLSRDSRLEYDLDREIRIAWDKAKQQA
ncbi:carboxylesterase/lipase family protein [Paenibacillus fonticola]|uniref:carboxylesterase/lipase family protein n=1 Tax=Paenibacillus fonticola TaxID=379896 RepID=UPI00037C07F1|nr:carboxylesterase/lipase family protein [Paenibacillus fonticola]